MKDYSMNLEERKDFILGYDVTTDGKIIVNFATGESFPLPYNEENEQIVLKKMKKQLDKASEKEAKLSDKVGTFKTCFTIFGGTAILIGLISLGIDSIVSDSRLIIGYFFSGVCGVGFLGSFMNFVRNKNVLNDLRKNKKFMEIEEKLNDNVRSNNNVLVNVSNKTKNAVKDFPKDRPVFNINSFNYVPFRDLEQIIENVDRNERFGFNYDKQEEPHNGMARKKVR